MAVDYICDNCGGNQIGRDAWAAWDVDAQDWVLKSVFDYAHCDACDKEARLIEVSLKSRTPTKF